MRTLRSNFEPGSPREAVRRAQWKALGLTDEDLVKPKIAVVNSSSELAICFSHLDGIAKSAPFTYDTLIGFTHTIEARNQTVGGNG